MSTRISPGWAATCTISAHPHRRRRNIGSFRPLHLLGQRRGRLYPPLRRRRASVSDPVRLTDRFFLGSRRSAASTFAASARACVRDHVRRRRHAWHRRLSQDPATRLGGRAYYLGRRSSNSRSVRQLRSLGLRPSVFVDVGAVWGVTQARLHDIRRDSARRQPRTTTGVSRATIGAGDRAVRYGHLFSQRAGLSRKSFSAIRQAAPLGRLRRQLDLAVRTVPDRYRPGPAPPARRRHQALHFNVGTAF